ncbi:hypothetical protein Bca52824_064363 [Brassica carinata]|uniref:Uncharacterized protein n=1 Tax=Brassica carinata TaxID=52824 RepID=A0A8X7QKY8_BRACI|nr:hypothetical protein Bca52824_064363 [Brassica carinata]
MFGASKDLSLCLTHASLNCSIIGKDDYDKDSSAWLLVGLPLDNPSNISAALPSEATTKAIVAPEELSASSSGKVIHLFYRMLYKGQRNCEIGRKALSGLNK